MNKGLTEERVFEGKGSQTSGNPEREKAGTDEKKKSTYLMSFPPSDVILFTASRKSIKTALIYGS